MASVVLFLQKRSHLTHTTQQHAAASYIYIGHHSKSSVHLFVQSKSHMPMNMHLPQIFVSGEDPPTDNNDISQFHCDTTNGDFDVIFYRDWSPKGYERAVELFERGFYDHSHFFRVIPQFLAQFGISYTEDEDLQTFADTPIPDDPQLNPPIPFEEGIISFAGSGPNSRTSHLFIAYGPYESFGQELWETPIGEVIHGMDTIRSLYGEYGDGEPDGDGPNQNAIHEGGEDYMVENFPNLDRFLTCIRVPIDIHLDEEEEEEGVDEEEEHEEENESIEREMLPVHNKDDKLLLRQRSVQKIEAIKAVYKKSVGNPPLTWGIVGVLLVLLFVAVRKIRSNPKKDWKSQ